MSNHAAPCAPIAIFAYRRTEHLAKTIDALERCPEFERSDVFVFSDGPKSDSSAADVRAVRAMLRARAPSNMTVIEAEKNQGLAASITAGASRLCARYGRVVVIEDDLLVQPCTLSWFNAGLDRFAEDERVWQISAHQFDVPSFAGRSEGLFLQLTTSWGWATWKRAWDRYDPDAKGWERLRQDKHLRRRFDLGGAYPYADMLERQMTGGLDSWAIRWWWTVFQNAGFGLFPPRTLIENIGFDDTATHYRFGALRKLLRGKSRPPLQTLVHPPETFHFRPADQRDVWRSIGKSPSRVFHTLARRLRRS